MATSEQNPYEPPREVIGSSTRAIVVKWRRIFWLGLMMLGLAMVIVGLVMAGPKTVRGTEDIFSSFLFFAGVTLCLAGSLVSSIGWLIQVGWRTFAGGNTDERFRNVHER
jgi:hypothetical protein